MLKDILANVAKAKEDLDKNQRLYWKEILQRFPVIMTKGLHSKINMMEYELNLMLRMAVKFKTSRIEIPVIKHNQYYHRTNSDGKIVVVLSKDFQGLRNPYSSDKDINLMSSSYSLEKDNIYYNDKEKKKSFEAIKLSYLKTLSDTNPQCQHAIIKGDKLEMFFKFYREITAFKKDLYDFWKSESAYHYGSHNVSVGGKEFCDKVSVQINSIGFDLSGVGSKYNNWYDVTPKQIVDYASNVYDTNGNSERWDDGNIDLSDDDGEFNNLRNGKEMSKFHHVMFKIIIDNWDSFEKVMDKHELIKKDIIIRCNKFIEAMQQHTTPWKVLNKIKGND